MLQFLKYSKLKLIFENEIFQNQLSQKQFFQTRSLTNLKDKGTNHATPYNV